MQQKKAMKKETELQNQHQITQCQQKSMTISRMPVKPEILGDNRDMFTLPLKTGKLTTATAVQTGISSLCGLQEYIDIFANIY